MYSRNQNTKRQAGTSRSAWQRQARSKKAGRHFPGHLILLAFLYVDLGVNLDALANSCKIHLLAAIDFGLFLDFFSSLG
ncbi:hypothetical protein EJB05_54607 [Eragrostis curvula]|uniref:Uncharacterized protein n=1 Tax=Eragrostis curvula TaxID=38414 RepID=A0A5J9SLY0_9POAL|nr:hypothetical protein EJB05_54607 [Eragrostis curvula]